MKIKNDKLKEVNGGGVQVRYASLTHHAVEASDRVATNNYYRCVQTVTGNDLRSDAQELPMTRMNDCFLPKYVMANVPRTSKACREDADTIKGLEYYESNDFVK